MDSETRRGSEVEPDKPPGFKEGQKKRRLPEGLGKRMQIAEGGSGMCARESEGGRAEGQQAVCFRAIQ